MHSDAAQPIENMRFGGKLAELGVQFQKNVLGDLFGRGSIDKNAKSDTEYHRLMLQHQVAESLVVVL